MAIFLNNVIRNVNIIAKRKQKQIIGW